MLGAGTNYQGGTASGSWENIDSTKFAATDTFLTTVNSTFYITGVQLEVGDTATPFEHRSYGDELARCQRYTCEFSYGEGDANAARIYSSGYSASAGMVRADFPVTMRDTPNLTYSIGGGGVVTTDLSNKHRIQLHDANDAAWRIYDVLAEAEL
jgi:hypothetical protein